MRSGCESEMHSKLHIKPSNYGSSACTKLFPTNYDTGWFQCISQRFKLLSRDKFINFGKGNNSPDDPKQNNAVLFIGTQAGEQFGAVFDLPGSNGDTQVKLVSIWAIDIMIVRGLSAAF